MLETKTLEIDEPYKIRAAVIDGSWWLVVKDLLEEIGKNSHNAARFIECIPESFKKKVHVKSFGTLYLIHEEGCKILVSIYGVKDNDFIDFLKSIFSRPIEEVAQEEVPAVLPAAESSLPVVSNDEVLLGLDKVLEENRNIVNDIVNKIKDIQSFFSPDVRSLPSEDEEPAIVPDAMEDYKTYYLPAKRKEWRVWINRVIDKLAIKHGGEQKITAGILYDNLYKHVENAFDINIKQLMREANSMSSYKQHSKSRMGLLNKNDHWMMEMLKYVYDMAIAAEVSLPKDFELVKLTVPAQRRSA